MAGKLLLFGAFLVLTDAIYLVESNTLTPFAIGVGLAGIAFVFVGVFLPLTNIGKSADNKPRPQ